MNRTRHTSFRDYLPGPDHPRQKLLLNKPDCDAHEWGEIFKTDDFVGNWIKSWALLLDQPFKGITIDNNLVPRLYPLASENQDHGAPTPNMVEAAEGVLQSATEAERQALTYALVANEWRTWINPEIYVFKNGIRLEESSDGLFSAIHRLLEASLSPVGYKKAVNCMKINRFLGGLVNGQGVMNEKSYNFSLFGTPSLTAPWGWNLYGHHLCLNCLVAGTQLVVSPVFMGAEPNIIDEGPEAGVVLFREQEDQARQLMQSLDSDLQSKVQLYDKLFDPSMPEGRYHRADQRTLGGAFQDNRVIPYEGLLVTDLPDGQQKVLKQIIYRTLDYLPTRVLDFRMSEIVSHWDETHIAWIGKFQDDDAFYYKIHSPVLLIEFDHHSGVFLTNKEPLPFHIHTIVRTPNGNDYGKELVKQYLARQLTEKHNAMP
ncbi:uncharacterized protein A1O9_12724 [Exophiala aquamarina CBS 119918]|uniref:DUF3500 domain-containing protein n=1 Tax=Exophiala aquamarina CBS 119918 TaxID=1182545 RepID=A0A072NUD1_9EURO|nr:uncharacterized protein A1O9_12724 [Exophiala aquamarina CBS 119918]KEF51221.1 hypothetical protein A1O9_12724 [Exophiala aquamarina CBS 119918]